MRKEVSRDLQDFVDFAARVITQIDYDSRRVPELVERCAEPVMYGRLPQRQLYITIAGRKQLAGHLGRVRDRPEGYRRRNRFAALIGQPQRYPAPGFSVQQSPVYPQPLSPIS